MAQSENQFNISSFYNIFKVSLSPEQQKVITSLLPKNYSFQPFKCTRSIDEQSLRSEAMKVPKKKLVKEQKDPDYLVNFTCVPKEPLVPKIESSQTIPGGEPFLECYLILKKLKKSIYAWPFKVPVDPRGLGIPEYLNIVFEPMDMKTIEENLKKEGYKHPAQFHRDMYKMLMNSYKFNQKNSEVFATTNDFEEEYLKYVREVKEGKLVWVDKKGVKLENIFSEQIPILSKDKQSSAENKPVRVYTKRGKLQKLMDEQDNDELYRVSMQNDYEAGKDTEKQKERGKGKGKEKDAEKLKLKAKESVKESEREERMKEGEREKDRLKMEDTAREKAEKKEKKERKMEKADKFDKIQKLNAIERDKAEKGAKLQLQKRERLQRAAKIERTQKLQKQRLQKQVVKVEPVKAYDIFQEYYEKEQNVQEYSDAAQENEFKQSRYGKQSKEQFSISNEPLKRAKQRHLSEINRIRRVKDKGELQNLREIKEMKQVTLVQNEKNAVLNQLQKKLTDLLKRLNEFQIPKAKNKLIAKATEGEHPNFNNFTSVTATQKKKLAERISLLSCLDLKYVVQICYRNKRNKSREEEGVYEIDLDKIDPKTLKELSNFVAMRTKWIRKTTKSKEEMLKMSQAEIIEQEIQNEPLFFDDNNYLEEEENLINIHEEHQQRLLENDRQIIVEQQDFHDHSYDRVFDRSHEIELIELNNSGEQSYQPGDDEDQFRF